MEQIVDRHLTSIWNESKGERRWTSFLRKANVYTFCDENLNEFLSNDCQCSDNIWNKVERLTIFGRETEKYVQ